MKMPRRTQNRITACCTKMRIVTVTNNYNISQSMKKSNKIICATSNNKSALASTQSDQSFLPTWRKLESLATDKALNKDWLDWVDAQADLSFRRAHVVLLSLSCSCLYYMTGAYIVHIQWLTDQIKIARMDRTKPRIERFAKQENNMLFGTLFGKNHWGWGLHIMLEAEFSTT